MLLSALALFSEAVSRSVSARLKSPESIGGRAPGTAACHPPGGVFSFVVVLSAPDEYPPTGIFTAVVCGLGNIGPLAPMFSKGEAIGPPWNIVTVFTFSSAGPTYPGLVGRDTFAAGAVIVVE